MRKFLTSRAGAITSGVLTAVIILGLGAVFVVFGVAGPDNVANHAQAKIWHETTAHVVAPIAKITTVDHPVMGAAALDTTTIQYAVDIAWTAPNGSKHVVQTTLPDSVYASATGDPLTLWTSSTGAAWRVTTPYVGADNQAAAWLALIAFVAIVFGFGVGMGCLDWPERQPSSSASLAPC